MSQNIRLSNKAVVEFTKEPSGYVNLVVRGRLRSTLTEEEFEELCALCARQWIININKNKE